MADQEEKGSELSHGLLSPAPESETEPDPDLVPFTRDREDWEDFVVGGLDAEDPEKLKAYLKELYAADIADILRGMDRDDGRRLFAFLDRETRGEVLHELEEGPRRDYLRRFSPDELAAILREQQSDEAAEICSLLDAEALSEVLYRIPPEERISITELLSYPENTAGSIMAKEFVFVRASDTVKRAIETIRRISREGVDFYTVFVVGADGKYEGHVGLKDLLLANPRTRVRRIMETELLPIPVYTDQEEVAQFFTRYDMTTAPVVDERGTMLGRITADDVMEILQDEASEDILRMGGLISGDENLSTPLWNASVKRLVWLALNLGTAFLAASVVSLFEATIAQAVILAALMPIVAGMGGNAAGQSVAIIVRTIALGELGAANAREGIRREALLGLFNGVFMGLLSGGVVYVVTLNGQGHSRALVLAAIISAAMFLNMLVAALAGATIPLLLKRIRIDPAIASSIFVTTCTDVLGFFAFLGLAALSLRFGFLPN